MADISTFKQKLNFVVPIFPAHYTQICHQIFDIWHQIKHLTNIWDQKIQKRMRYRLGKKKTAHIVSLSKTKFVIKLSKYIMKKMFHENLRWKKCKNDWVYQGVKLHRTVHSLDNFNQLTRRVLVLAAAGFFFLLRLVLWPVAQCIYPVDLWLPWRSMTCQWTWTWPNFERKSESEKSSL